MIDMGFSGNIFTWARGKHVHSRIERRLDKALCNMDWRTGWPNAFVQHLPQIYSDHSPILLNLDNQHTNKMLQRPFRFLAA